MFRLSKTIPLINLAVVLLISAPLSRHLDAKSATQMRTEQEKSALQILAKALLLTEVEHHSAIRAAMVSSLAVVYVRLGQKEKGEALLRRSRELIEEDDDLTKDCYECSSKEFFRILVAIDHSQAGHMSQALEMLEQLVHFDKERQTANRGELLAGLASVFAGLGNPERAGQLLNDAFEAAKTTPDAIGRSAALEDIAKRYALLGQLELSTRVVGAMDKGPFKDQAQIAIAKKYAEGGQFDRALEMNELVETTNFKPDILVIVAKQYLNNGQKDKATELLYKARTASKNVHASNLQEFTRFDITLLLAEAGRFADARRILRATKAQAPKLRLMTGLALVFSRTGRRKTAEKLLADAYKLTSFSRGTYFQARDVLEVANAYAGIGERERAGALLAEAVEVLDAVQEPTNKGLIFSEIAESYLVIGDDERAVNIAERVEPEGNGKFLTLLWIAGKFAQAENLIRLKDKLSGELMRP
jgi:tetratricopeptide (TPR) repeat protein